jgi:hypothetical protein
MRETLGAIGIGGSAGAPRGELNRYFIPAAIVESSNGCFAYSGIGTVRM